MNKYSYLDLIEFARNGRKLAKSRGSFLPGQKERRARPKYDKPPRKGPFTKDGVKRQWGPAVASPPVRKVSLEDELEQWRQEEFERRRNSELQPRADVLNQYLWENPEEINAYFRYASGNPDSTMEVQPFDFSREYLQKYDPNAKFEYMSPYEYEEESKGSLPSFGYAQVDPDFKINIDTAIKQGHKFYDDYYWNREDAPYLTPGEAYADGIMRLKHQEELLRRRVNQSAPNVNNEYLESLQEQSLRPKEELMPKPSHLKHGGIYIKPENRGKFTATMKRTGKTAEELSHSKNPVTRKRAIFAINSRKWHQKK